MPSQSLFLAQLMKTINKYQNDYSVGDLSCTLVILIYFQEGSGAILCHVSSSRQRGKSNNFVLIRNRITYFTLYLVTLVFTKLARVSMTMDIISR